MSSVIKARGDKRSWFVMVCLRLRCLFFFFAAKGVSNQEGRQGWAPQTRVENFMWTDTLGEGRAHCWRGSSDFYSTSSPCSPSQHTHTVSLYSLHSLSCNSRNICAQVYRHVHGPWVHREGEGYMVHCKKILLILLPLYSFPCCSFAFASPLLHRAFRFRLSAPHFSHLHAIWEPSVTKLADLSSVFSKFLLPLCHFLLGSLLHLCF